MLTPVESAPVRHRAMHQAWLEPGLVRELSHECLRRYDDLLRVAGRCLSPARKSGCCSARSRPAVTGRRWRHRPEGARPTDFPCVQTTWPPQLDKVPMDKPYTDVTFVRAKNIVMHRERHIRQAEAAASRLRAQARLVARGSATPTGDGSRSARTSLAAAATNAASRSSRRPVDRDASADHE